MQEIKWWLDSQTIRANLVTILGSVVLIAKMLGIEIGSQEVQSIIDGVVGIVVGMSAILAIIGRLKARHTLTTTKS